jgi:hypothetical protein
LVHSLNVSSISSTVGKISTNKSARHQLYVASFPAVAGIVETLVAGNNAQCELSAESRITLCTALSNARQYVAFILPLFYECGTLDLICDTKARINLAYSDHGHLLLQSPAFPHFRRLWEEIRSEKRRLRHIVKNICSNKPWKTAIIHRLVKTSNGDSIRGRRVVLAPTNPNEYADETEFYQMFSESCHVVGRGGGSDVQLHPFVCATLCDLSDDEIRDILGDRSGQSFLGQKWFLGAHVVNLDRIKPWETWMDQVNKDMLSTLTACRLVHRSKNREAATVGKDEGA